MPTKPPNSYMSAAEVPVPPYVTKSAVEIYQTAYVLGWNTGIGDMECVLADTPKITGPGGALYFKIPNPADPPPGFGAFKDTYPELYRSGFYDGWNAVAIAYVQLLIK